MLKFAEFSFFAIQHLKNIVFRFLPVFMELVLAMERFLHWLEGNVEIKHDLKYEMFIIAESTLAIC